MRSLMFPLVSFTIIAWALLYSRLKSRPHQPVIRNVLDNLIHRPGPIALLKVDVEGYERHVFEGAPEVLQRTRCVHFEVSSLHFARFGYTTRDVLTLLRDAGFDLFRSTAPRRFTPIAIDFDTESFENLLALRDVNDFTRRTGWAQPSSRA